MSLAISPGVDDTGCVYEGVGVIYNFDGEYQWVRGSGVAISDRHVLTAMHVVDEQNNPGTLLPVEEVGFRISNFDTAPMHPLSISRPYLQSPPWSNDLAILTFAANTFDTWYEPDFRENILGLDIVILGAGLKGVAVSQSWVYDPVADSQGVVRWGTNEVESINRTQGPGWGEIREI